jgi:hypothetical protein
LVDQPLVVEESSLSVAWAKAFLQATAPGVGALSPLVVIVTNMNDSMVAEDHGIRELLDDDLRSRGELGVHTVANTIFPGGRMWDPGRAKELLYERYERVYRRVKRDPRNRYGTYFGRLIGLDGRGNQLDGVIELYKAGIHRRTALQISLFDPQRDRTRQPRRGFPCLDHVALGPFGAGGLEITGLYVTQHLYAKAYGNYLGLARVGRFVAHELGLELRRLTCVSLIARLDDGVAKGSVSDLRLALQAALG